MERVGGPIGGGGEAEADRRDDEDHPTAVDVEEAVGRRSAYEAKTLARETAEDRRLGPIEKMSTELLRGQKTTMTGLRTSLRKMNPRWK